MYWIVLKTPKWNELFIFWKQKVAKKSEIKNIVASEYYFFKRSGATKSIFFFLQDIYHGLNERTNQKVKYTHKETHALVANQFYDVLEQKTSKHKTKLIWLKWELKEESLLKEKDIDISWLLRMLSIYLSLSTESQI